MRLLLTGLAAAAVLSISSLNAHAWDLEDMNYQIEHTNVVVSGICSGTVVDVAKRFILTAYHCITDNMQEKTVKTVDPNTGEITEKHVMEKVPMYIETWDRQDYKVVHVEHWTASIKGWDDHADIAVLQVDDMRYRPTMAAPLAPENYVYRRGAKVYAVGNPLIEFDDSVTDGIISAPARSLDVGNKGYEVPYFQHSAPIIGGNSGGAIYDDHGQMIGTVSAGVRGVAIGFAVPISETRKLLLKIGAYMAPAQTGPR